MCIVDRLLLGWFTLRYKNRSEKRIVRLQNKRVVGYMKCTSLPVDTRPTSTVINVHMYYFVQYVSTPIYRAAGNIQANCLTVTEIPALITGHQAIQTERFDHCELLWGRALRAQFSLSITLRKSKGQSQVTIVDAIMV